jgi:hypothetical protein
MKTAEEIKIEEIRTKALRVIDSIITLKANVFNGCYADKAELERELPRIAAIKAWAEANGQIQNIRHYFAAKSFGQNKQFAAVEVSQLFY